MRANTPILFVVALALLGCRIPMFPKHIRIDKCDQVNSDRLFNRDQFSPKNGRAELVIIRDVGYYGADFYLPVTIDSVHFADMRVWECATAYLEPGVHKVEFNEPAQLISIGKRASNTLEIELTAGSKMTVRIDLGRSYPPIRLTQN